MVKSKAKSKRKSAKSSAKNSTQPETPTLSPKEERALKRKKAQEKAEFIQYTGAVFGAAAVLGLVLAVATGEVKLAAGAIVGIPCLALSYKYPRQALWAFLAYLPINGTVTYWLAGGNALFQLAKDAFFIPAAIK